MAKDKIKSLYNALSEYYPMESEAEFRKNIVDPTRRKSAYEALVKSGYNMEPFEEFERKLGYGGAGDNMLGKFSELRTLGQNTGSDRQPRRQTQERQTRRQTQATPAAAGGQVQTPLPATTPSALSGCVRGLQPEAPSPRPSQNLYPATRHFALTLIK